DPAAPEASFLAELRRWRRREFVRIAWRDLAGWADLTETLGDLTAFADAAIAAALGYARRALVTRYGEPRSAGGEAQPLVVIGMGKLGGGELNFSSDVDLVLLFPEHGETDGPRSIANEEFFTRLGQALVRLLEAPTPEGFVLRVDLRLRPFGDSGPLVSSFASFEDYLPRHGRDWERYAYVKARPVTSAERYGDIDAAAIRPFVYRRYLDYGVFESLRDMKALMEREMQRRELADHIKLGPGGIREIEFIVQALQITRGGRDRRLQTPSLLAALARIGETRLLPRQAPASASRSPWARATGRQSSPSSMSTAGGSRGTSAWWCSAGRSPIRARCASISDGSGTARPRPRRSQRRSRAPASRTARRPRGCCSSCAPRRWCADSMSPDANASRSCCRRCSRTSRAAARSCRCCGASLRSSRRPASARHTSRCSRRTPRLGRASWSSVVTASSLRRRSPHTRCCSMS
ncbi:MAG: hypothetical protein E6K48_00325, partial [Gammaproteobacteria bacterium]